MEEIKGNSAEGPEGNTETSLPGLIRKL